MDSIYRDNILDHFKHPRNFGKLENPDASSQENNDLCGDRIGMQITIEAIGNKGKAIENAMFTGEGCAITVASASMLTDIVKNKKLDEVMKMGTKDVLNYLGITLTPNRIKCAVLPLEALQKAIVSLKSK